MGLESIARRRQSEAEWAVRYRISKLPPPEQIRELPAEDQIRKIYSIIAEHGGRIEQELDCDSYGVGVCVSLAVVAGPIHVLDVTYRIQDHLEDPQLQVESSASFVIYQHEVYRQEQGGMEVGVQYQLDTAQDGAAADVGTVADTYEAWYATQRAVLTKLGERTVGRVVYVDEGTMAEGDEQNPLNVAALHAMERSRLEGARGNYGLAVSWAQEALLLTRAKASGLPRGHGRP